MGKFSLASLIAAVVGLIVGGAVVFGVLTWFDPRGASDERLAVQRVTADVEHVSAFLAGDRFTALNAAFVEANFDPARDCPMQPDMAAIIGSIESEAVLMEELQFRPSELFRPTNETLEDLAALPDVALPLERGVSAFTVDTADTVRGRAAHFYLRSRDLFELFEDINARESLVSQIVGVCSLFRQHAQLIEIVDVVSADLAKL